MKIGDERWTVGPLDGLVHGDDDVLALVEHLDALHCCWHGIHERGVILPLTLETAELGQRVCDVLNAWRRIRGDVAGSGDFRVGTSADRP